MRRLNILPEGYIYPKQERPVRDLLRRRLLFVKHRTSNILSLQSMISRNLGIRMSVNGIKQLKEEDAESLFESPYLVVAAQNNIETIRFLTTRIKGIERVIRPHIKLREEFEYLLTIPGVGDILGFTIMLEVGELSRFPRVGDYSSYCRCVKSERLSDSKKKGKNNQKNGNKYLSWAYVEAANFLRRYCPKAERFYQRKMAKTKEVVAIKALSNKLSKASYYIMRDRVPFDENKLFA